MTGYFTAFLVGGAIFVLARLALWRLVYRTDDSAVERKIGVVALLFFIWPISGVVALVGLIGMHHEASLGHQPPVPLSVIYTSVGIGAVLIFVTRQGRRAARRRRRRAP